MLVYKRIEPGNIRITPFQVHKTYRIKHFVTTSFGNSLNSSYPTYISNVTGSSGIQLYLGTHIKNQPNYGDVHDPQLINASSSNNIYNYLTWNMVDSTFYNDYYMNQGSRLGDYNKNQRRDLYDDCVYIKIPQNYFSEGIVPGSFKLFTEIYPGRYTHIIDDSRGNLLLSDSIVCLRQHSHPWNSHQYNQYYQSNSINLFDFNTGFDSKNYCFDRVSKLKYNTYNLNRTFEAANFYPMVTFNGTDSYAQIENYTTFNNINIDDNFGFLLIFTPPATSGLMATDMTLISNATHKTELVKEKYSDGSRYYEHYNKQVVSNPDSYDFKIEILKDNGRLQFSRFDGFNLFQITSSNSILGNGRSGFWFEKSGSIFKFFDYWNAELLEIDYTIKNNIRCLNDLFIGSSYNTNYFSGNIEKIQLFNNALPNITDIHTYSLYNELELGYMAGTLPVDNYMGNIFYENGAVVLTGPYLHNPLSYTWHNPLYTSSLSIKDYWAIEFKGTRTIHETEILCQIQPSEFNMTMNPTVREQVDINYPTLATFATHSDFTPYITTIGLYNESAELLAVAKLSRPIEKIDNMDMTFVIRYDS